MSPQVATGHCSCWQWKSHSVWGAGCWVISSDYLRSASPTRHRVPLVTASLLNDDYLGNSGGDTALITCYKRSWKKQGKYMGIAVGVVLMVVCTQNNALFTDIWVQVSIGLHTVKIYSRPLWYINRVPDKICTTYSTLSHDILLDLSLLVESINPSQYAVTDLRRVMVCCPNLRVNPLKY